MKINPNVPRKSLNDFAYYITITLFGNENYIGNKVINEMYEYQFQNISNFKKGSIELTKKGVVVTNKTLDDVNCEHL